MKGRYEYKRLGDYIEKCEGRNSQGLYGIDDVLGVNNEGKIVRSKAKLHDVDLSPYKVVKNNNFVYNPARLDLGSISLYKGEGCVVSTLYVVFKVREDKKSELLTDYLDLYLKRKEFHRFVGYVNWGSAREYFWYDNIAEVLLPVPPIEEQRRIVAEYQTVERRIKNNKALIQKLEETAQAIYHHTFVEGIDENNLPEGWRKGKLEDVATIIMGQSPDGDSLNENGKGEIFYQGCTDFGYRFPSIRIYTEAPTRFAEYGDVLMSVRAPVGDLNIAPFRCAIGRGISAIREKKRRNGYIFYLLKTKEQDLKVSDGTGTVFGSINKEELHSLPIVVPTDVDIDAFQNKISIIDNCIEFYSRELTHLHTLQSLLTSKLA